MSKKLTPKQQDFRTAYIRSKTKNATEAARVAGYKSPNKQGPRLTHVPAIKAAIEASEGVALERAIITESWVMGGIKTVTERCMQVEPVMEFDHAEKRMVQKTTLDPSTGKTVGLYQFDSSSALRGFELGGKRLGLFTDRLQIESEQLGQLLDLVTSILKRTLPEDLWPKVSQEFARASETYGNNDAVSS